MVKSTNSPTNRFQCHICSKICAGSSNLDAHLTVHSNIRAHPCTEEGCDKAFKTRGDMLKHVRRVHKGIKPCQCPHCPHASSNASDLKRHVRTHTGERPFACQFCDKAFGREWGLQQHQRTHDKKRPYPCRWEGGCGKSYTQANNRNDHERKHELRRYPCTFKGCKAKFPTELDLTEHIDTKHVCSACDKTFDVPGGLTQHMKTHSEEKPFVCLVPDCGYASPWKSNFKTHMRSHTGERPYQCEWKDCSFRSSTSDGLTVHMRYHTGERPYVCTWNGCSSNYATSGNLKSHIRSAHTKERPFKCTVENCGAAFAEKTYLVNHEVVHSGVKAFGCPEPMCDARFTRRYSVAVHMRSHRGEKLYMCPECGNKFCQSSALSLHVKKHVESEKWTIICPFADLSTHMATGEDFPCERRFRHQLALQDHIEKCHTEEGLQKKFQTEEKLATFFTQEHILVTRDYENTINFKECPHLPFPGSRSRPDFYLPELSADIGATILIGNDEYAHRAYSPQCEFNRMLKIAGCVFENPRLPQRMIYIRFNPHFYTKNGTVYDPSLETRYKKLLDLLDSLPELVTDGLLVIYMYYDLVDGELSIFSEEDESLSYEGRSIQECSMIYPEY